MKNSFNNNIGNNLPKSANNLPTLGNMNQSSNYMDNYLYMMLFTTLLAALLPILTKSINVVINNNSKTVISFFRRNFNKLFGYKNNKIILSYKNIINKYGRTNCEVSEDMMGLLHYINTNLYKFKNLHTLRQDECMKKYKKNNIQRLEEDATYLPLYKIDQIDKFEIYSDNLNKKIFISSKLDDGSNNNNDEKTNMCNITKTILTLSSKDMNLSQIQKFIDDCREKYIYEKLNDNKRYIYTYYEMDKTNNRPLFRKEEFKSFSDFKTLFCKQSRQIKEYLDFFQSSKGIKWYKNRNLPYHLTFLLFGEPGTGKSAIAAAIAKEYNLSIVRIKLSSIKTNKEFIKVFKTNKFVEGDREYSYDQLLYLFDEIDTETNKVLLDRNYKGTLASNNVSQHKKESTIDSSAILLKAFKDNSNNPDKKFSKCINDTLNNVVNNDTDKLSLGTILEEISGINQMWGRKMVFISNYPEKLDKALLRPGRIDHKIELLKSTKKDTISIIKNFLNIDKIPDNLLDKIPDNKFTPAEIVHICKNNSIDKIVALFNTYRT